MAWINPKDYDKEQRKKSHELIRRGNIRHLLTPPQRVFYDKAKLVGTTELAYYCTRKLGKTLSLLLMEWEDCILHKNYIWRHIFPELKQAREAVYPIFRELCEFMPDDVMPKLLKSESAMVFPNGSQVRLGGASSENIESSRGPLANGLVFDEIATWDEANFDYALYSILYPQLSTTNGPVWHATTPPESPSHVWLTNIYPRMKVKGLTIEATIEDNTLLSPEMVEKIVERYSSAQYPNGRDNPNFQREYMLKLVANTSRRVCPEFNTAEHVYDGDPVTPIINPFTKNKIDVVCFNVADLGLGKTDFTAILCGLLDWTTGSLFIVRESVIDEIHSAADTAAAWREMRDWVAPHSSDIRNHADCFEEIRITLTKDHGIPLRRVPKHDLSGAIGRMRNALSCGKVKIHESCKHLITQLEMSLWKETTTDNRKIERSELTGHSDSLMALCYMVRLISDWNQRPTNTTAPSRKKSGLCFGSSSSSDW